MLTYSMHQLAAAAGELHDLGVITIKLIIPQL